MDCRICFVVSRSERFSLCWSAVGAYLSRSCAFILVLSALEMFSPLVPEDCVCAWLRSIAPPAATNAKVTSIEIATRLAFFMEFSLYLDRTKGAYRGRPQRFDPTAFSKGLNFR